MASVLENFVISIQQNNYTGCIILAAVGYDYILTFSDEVEYIWNRPWSWVSTLFVLVRYFGLCSAVIFSLGAFKLITLRFLKLRQPDQSGKLFPSRPYTGNILVYLGMWTIMIFICSADLAMILRVWALYNRSKLILGILLTCYAPEVILYAFQSIVVLEKPAADASQILGYSFCYVQFFAPRWSAFATSGIQTFLATLMCLLLTTRFISQSLEMYHVTKQFDPNRYMLLITKDGVLYFVAVLLYSVITLLNYLLNNWFIMIGVAQLVPTLTLTPRFMLSLRALYASDIKRNNHMSDIDTAFGVSVMFRNNSTNSAAISFVGVEQDMDDGWRGDEYGEETEMKVMGLRR